MDENKYVNEIKRLLEEKIKLVDKELGDPLIYADSNNFDEILSRNKIVVVEFSAPWCNPCKAYTPVFKRVARKILTSGRSNIAFVYLDTDKAPEIADRYSIDNIPTTIIFVNGHAADVIMGATQESKLEERILNIAREVLEKTTTT